MCYITTIHIRSDSYRDRLTRAQADRTIAAVVNHHAIRPDLARKSAVASAIVPATAP